MNILILAASRDGIWLFYLMETWCLSAFFIELCRLRWQCSSWPSQRWNSAFQTPNIPWFSQKIKRKLFSLCFLMCVVWQLHEEIGRHRDGDASVWAALNSYGRCCADIGADVRAAVVWTSEKNWWPLHSEITHSDHSSVLLFRLLLMIMLAIEGMFLNMNFPKMTRNRSIECHKPFPLHCIRSVWRALEMGDCIHSVHTTPHPHRLQFLPSWQALP